MEWISQSPSGTVLLKRLLQTHSSCIYNGTIERKVAISTVKTEFSSLASLLFSSLTRFVLQGHYEILSYPLMQGINLKIS
jgi:hypothetical protein